MEITITLKELIFIIIAIGVIIFIGYLIKLLKELIETAQRTNKILADAEVISAIASEKTQALDEASDDLVESVKVVAGLLKGNQSSLKAVTNIVNSVAGIKNIITDKTGKDSKK